MRIVPFDGGATGFDEGFEAVFGIVAAHRILADLKAQESQTRLCRPLGEGCGQCGFSVGWSSRPSFCSHSVTNCWHCWITAVSRCRTMKSSANRMTWGFQLIDLACRSLVAQCLCCWECGARYSSMPCSATFARTGESIEPCPVPVSVAVNTPLSRHSRCEPAPDRAAQLRESLQLAQECGLVDPVEAFRDVGIQAVLGLLINRDKVAPIASWTDRPGRKP